MNRTFRLVWSKRLHMRVAVSETARSDGKAASGESTVASVEAGGVGPQSRPGFAAKALSCVGLAAALLVAGAPAWALNLPAGSILDIGNSSNGNSGNSYTSGWANYSFNFTPTTSGNNYVLFAFRQDPAFWTFGQTSLTVAGDSTNLFVDPNFTSGGTFSSQSGLQAPAGWGIVYQTGTTPYAAGSWQQGFNGDSTKGSWYDGAVGSFDGIYQGVNLTAGTAYTLGFSLYGDNPASAPGIEMGVFEGACVTLTGSAADCTPDNPSFTILATPGQTVSAGNPATNIDTAAASYQASDVPTSVNPVFDGGTLVMNASPTQDFTITTNGGTIDQAGASSTISGVLSDATQGGSLTFVNSGSGGSVGLSGVNTYTGSTTIDSGATVALVGNGSIAASSGVNDNGTLDISGTNAGASLQSLAGSGAVQLGGQTLTITNAHDTFSGSIGGTGGVAIAGGSETFAGNNTYTGGTSISGGATLQVGADANLGDSSGSVNLDGGTLRTTASFTTSRDIALGANGGTISTDAGTSLGDATGQVSGSGPLVKSGDGTLVLGGNVSHSGGTVVNGGTLVLGGNNSYSGGTTVNSGATLQVSADNNLGATSNNPLTIDGGTLHNTASLNTGRDVALGGGGATISTDAQTTLAVGGTVSGTGSLTKSGAGALALTGSNTYSGGTSIVGGTIQVAADANLGDSAGALSLDGGTLQATASLGTARNIALGTNGGTISTDAGITLTDATGSVSGTGILVKGGDGTLALGGSLSHTGGTTVNGGTLVLSGSNSYSGGTTVNSGATLQVSADNNLGATSNNPLTLDNGTLQATASFTTDRDITLGAGNGFIATDAGVTLSDAGQMSGAGALIKGGDGTLVLGGNLSQSGPTAVFGGTLVLTGNNTYGGLSAAVYGGTLQVASDSNLGAGGDIWLMDGTLKTTDSFTTARNVELLGGTGTIDVAGGTVLTNAGGSVSGNGTLVKNGAGELAFSGSLSHAGGTVVNDGVLELSGNNSYTGGTTLNGGVLRVSADNNLGDPSSGLAFNGGTLQSTASFASDRGVSVAAAGGTVSTDASTSLTLNGSLTGAGRLTKAGAGTLVLAGDNSGGPAHLQGTGWTGGLAIDAGRVDVTNPWGLGWGDVVLNGGTIHTQVDILTGQTIALVGGSALNIDAGTTTTLTGNLLSAGGAGSGCFVKGGQGTLDMKGSAIIAAGTCVQQGTLRANGALASDVWVDPGAVLGGAGVIQGQVNVRGTLSPGNSPGYLTVAGPVNMAAGSTYQEDIAGTTPASAATPVGATGYYSVLRVTNGGQFAIASGSTLAPKLTNLFSPSESGYGSTPYTPVVGDSFRIVTADGGISGRFTTLAQPDGLAAGTKFAAFYNMSGSNSIDLAVVPTSYSGWLTGGNSNARAAAGAMDRILDQDQAGNATAAQDELAYATARQGAAALPGYFKALSGEIHASLVAAAAQGGLALQDSVSGQLNGLGGAGQVAGAEPTQVRAKNGLWIDTKGNRAKWSGDDAASGFKADRTQVTVGADFLRQGATRIGAGFSHANTSVSADNGSGSVGEDIGFVYGQHATAGMMVDGIVAYGSSSIGSERSDPTGISASALATSAHGNSALAGVGLRAPRMLAGRTVEPFARFTVQNVSRAAVTEGGASPAALALDRFSQTGTRLVAGVSGASVQADPLQAAKTYRYSLGLGMDGGALVRPVVQANLAGQAIGISAPHVGRVFAQFTAAGTYRTGMQTYLYYGLSGEVREGKTDLGVNAGLRMAF